MPAALTNVTVGNGNGGTLAQRVLSSDGTGTGNLRPAMTLYNSADAEINFLPSAAANGLTSSRINAAATTNATSLKAAAGNVYEIDIFNNAAYTVFLKFYNKAAAPTVGTDTPIWTIPIAAGTGYARSFAFGKGFAIGIALAITKLQADSDTTAVVAGDVTGSIDWI